MDTKALKLLLVEDSDPDVFLLTKYLSAHESSPSLQRVHNGEQALDCLFRRNEFSESDYPDAIVLDLNLPRITGYEILGMIKGVEGVSNIPVIVLSTSHSTIDRERCLAMGAQAYYIKPDDLSGYRELAVHLMNDELPKICARNQTSGVH